MGTFTAFFVGMLAGIVVGVVTMAILLVIKQAEERFEDEQHRK